MTDYTLKIVCRSGFRWFRRLGKGCGRHQVLLHNRTARWRKEWLHLAELDDQGHRRGTGERHPSNGRRHPSPAQTRSSPTQELGNPSNDFLVSRFSSPRYFAVSSSLHRARAASRNFLHVLLISDNLCLRR